MHHLYIAHQGQLIGYWLDDTYGRDCRAAFALSAFGENGYALLDITHRQDQIESWAMSVPDYVVLNGLEHIYLWDDGIDTSPQSDIFGQLCFIVGTTGHARYLAHIKESDPKKKELMKQMALNDSTLHPSKEVVMEEFWRRAANAIAD